MKRPLFRLMAVLVLLMFGTGARAETRLPGPLVDVDWLAAHQGGVVVLDVRSDTDSFSIAPASSAQKAAAAASLNLCSDPPPPTSFRIVGHIPGSVLINPGVLQGGTDADGIDRQAPSAEAFTALMRDAGLDAGAPVVIAHPGRSVDDLTWAARLYWVLKLHGHDNAAILDGGIAAWQRADLPLTGTPQAPQPGTFTAGPPTTPIGASTEDVATAWRDGGVTLIDGRSPDQFSGQTRRSYVAEPGHIEGSVNLPFTALGQAWRPAYLLERDALAAAFAEAGIDTSRPAIALCNSGRLAALHWFVLSEVFGNPDVTLYDGSLLAWTREGRPVVAP